MIHARFCSSIWFKQMVLDMCVIVYVAVFRFYKPAFYSGIHILLKSEATSYMSNSIFYKNIWSLTEVLVLFHQKLLKY